MVNRRNKQLRIRKDAFLPGYYSIHETLYNNGVLLHDLVLATARTKKEAERIKRGIKKGKIKSAYL